MPRVALLMGSKSDYEALIPAIRTLKELEIAVDARVLSAHRTPEEAAAYARDAKVVGIEVLLAAAGKAAHLAGVLAAHTTLPVIGIPMASSFMGGLDALLSTVQMPAGIPVATVAVGGAENAALLAAQMLALKYPEIGEKLELRRAKMRADITHADEAVQALAKEL